MLVPGSYEGTMKINAIGLALGTLLSLPLPATATAAEAKPAAPTPVAPTASTEPDLETLIAKLAGLSANSVDHTLQQGIRDLKDPEIERAACIYIRAIADGNVAAFMSLVPDKGLVLENENTNKKEKLPRVEVAKRATARTEFGRPAFLGVMNDMASEDPKSVSWIVDRAKDVLRLSANGAFAWATLSRGADGRYLIKRITISANND
jgi:hypothetical protein